MELTSNQKLAAVGAGVAVLAGLFFAFRNSGSSQASTATTDGTVPTSGFDIGGTLYVPTTEYDINNVYGTQTITTTAPGTPQVGTTAPTSSGQTTTPTTTTSQPTTAYILPADTSSTTEQVLEQTAGTHVVREPDGSISVASGGDSYNEAVNQAGGQWINGQWVAGTYNSSGQFVAANAKAASIYNAAEEAAGKSARAIVAGGS